MKGLVKAPLIQLPSKQQVSAVHASHINLTHKVSAKGTTLHLDPIVFLYNLELKCSQLYLLIFI